MTIVILFDRIRCSDGGRGEDRQRLPDKMGDVSSHRRFLRKNLHNRYTVHESAMEPFCRTIIRGRTDLVALHDGTEAGECESFPDEWPARASCTPDGLSE